MLCRLVVRETAGFDSKSWMNARLKLVVTVSLVFFCVFGVFGIVVAWLALSEMR